MQRVKEIIEQVTQTLSEVAQSDVVAGSPIEVGRVTVIPLCRVSAGFGGGGGGGSGRSGTRKGGAKSESGTGEAGGSAGAALVRPVAVVAFTPQGVRVLPIPERQGKLGKLIDQIPDLIEKFQKREG